MRQFELVEGVRNYDPTVNEALLNRAYVFAMKAHGTQTRASGDPYFSHPLEVAGILTSMRMDGDTIATALLHDVVEDTVATIEEIEDLFGPKISELVDGVTKLSKIELQTESRRQAENFRKFVLAMSNDIRVLLVKLADRLHNMRTLHFIKNPEKRKRISLETVEIYAPLAERLGMNEMKDELTDLAFQNIDPEGMESITARLHYLIGENPYLEKEMVEALKGLMRDNTIEADVRGRIKQPYSIWKKMERDNMAFEQLSDVMAFRIIVPDIETCYLALCHVHQAFSLIPGRFKDYISIPKRNLYRSIHTSVIGPHKQRLEIQIRTHRMHQEAEYGVAAHWSYKLGKPEVAEGGKLPWIQELLEILEDASNPEEFLEHTKLAMFQDKVFCFTPKGELVNLPRGASPVDFAYAVHTEVGDHCVGAKINGRMVSLRHQLSNGDQVQILTSDGQTPSSRWENYVVTGKARSAIRRHVRSKRHAGYLQLGETLIERACKYNNLDYNETIISEAAPVLNIEDDDTLLVMVGQGTLSENEVLSAAYPGFTLDKRSDGIPSVHHDWEKPSDTVIPISGIKREGAVHLAECCHPVRDDRIVGLRIVGKGMDVHTITCGTLDEYDDKPELWVDLKWQAGEDDAFYAGQLRLNVVNERGALASIAETVSKAGGNLSNLTIPERDPEFIVMIIDVEVRDVKHLMDVKRALRVNRVISAVERNFG